MLEIIEQEHNVDSIEELLKFQNRPIKQFLNPTEINIKMEPVLEQIPNEAGVYYFVDNRDQVLYIGKAKSLKDRVRSYFQADAVNSKKISSIMRQLNEIRWIETDTELAALILESREIKKYKPPYNVLEKHYRNYPFIQITLNERFPRIDYIREINDGHSELYGPFRNFALVADIIDSINKKFKLRKCTTNIVPNPENKPCFYYHIERCCSPCSTIVDDNGYFEELERVQNFLSSFGNGVIKQLKDKMTSLSDTLNFEEASIIKDKIQELTRILDRNSNVATSINKYNLILIIPSSAIEKTIEIFIINRGRLIHQQSIGRKAPLDNINMIIHDAYFNCCSDQISYTQKDIDELRIINSWLHRNRSESKFIYCDGLAENEIIERVEFAIRSTFTATADQAVELYEED
jgi:excinuclease UvrABC nuclease subunit